MTTSKVTLHYFDFRGRGEALRLLLTVAGKEFEDHRIPRSDWEQYKSEAPFGKVPWMEIDGKPYAQSVALANFFAREFGLYGKTNWDALTIDTVVQLYQDLTLFIRQYNLEKDPGRKDELGRDLREQHLPRFCGYFEKMLADNGTGFVVGDDISLADVYVFDFCTSKLAAVDVSYDAFPNLTAFVKKIGSIDRIKTYIEKRPVTSV